MGILTKIVNFFIKFAFAIIGLSIALVPVIYMFGNQWPQRQEYTTSMDRFQNRLEQIQALQNCTICNIYLRGGDKKLAWSDINSTLALADFIHYQLQTKDVTVIKKTLDFRKPAAPKKSKINQNGSSSELQTTSSLVESPPLKWLKDIIQPHLGFEHQTLKQKHWILIVLGELDPKVANQITNILKKNPNYKFLLISSWELTSKMITVETIHPTVLQHLAVVEEQQKEDIAEQKQKKKDEVIKQKKDKKEKKHRVKQVKVQSPQSNETSKTAQL